MISDFDLTQFMTSMEIPFDAGGLLVMNVQMSVKLSLLSSHLKRYKNI